MFLVYVTVIAIVLIMVAFVALLIVRLVKVMGSQIRRNAMRQLGRYANLLDQKSKELEEIEGRIDTYCGSDSVQPLTDVKDSMQITYPKMLKTARYMSDNLPYEYKCLRQFAKINCNRKVQELKNYNLNRNDKTKYEKITEVLNLLTESRMFALLSISNEQIVEKLKEICGDGVLEFLYEYQQMRQDKRFDLQDFIFYLRQEKKCLDDTIIVEMAYEIPIDVNNVNVVVKDDLLEGFIMKQYGKIYDFGLNRGEIGL